MVGQQVADRTGTGDYGAQLQAAGGRIQAASLTLAQQVACSMNQGIIYSGYFLGKESIHSVHKCS